MPRVGRPSRTPTPSAGPSVLNTPKTDSSHFGLLREMLEEDGLWDSDDSSTHSDYEFNNDSDMLASSMLPISASGGKKKPKKKKGKGKAITPGPKTVMITSSGVSQTPIQQQQQRLVSKEVFTNEDQQEEMSIEIVEELVGRAFISVMEGHFAKLYMKIDNLKMEVSTLKTTVVSVLEENKKIGEIRGNAPDQELQPPATPRTPTKDLTIRSRPVLPALWKRAGRPLAQEVITRNWAKQVGKDNAMPMNVDESDAEPGRPGKAPRLTSPPPCLMHFRHAGASATVIGREDDRGENDKGGSRQSAWNPRKQNGRGRSRGSGDRVTELRNTITWRKEENDRGERRPGGRGGQQKRGELEAPEREKEDGRSQRSRVITKYDDSRGVTEVYDCHCNGRGRAQVIWML